MARLSFVLFILICLLSTGCAYAFRSCNFIWYDEFGYGQPTRALNGNGGWNGTATTEIQAWDNWCCVITGGTGSVDACKTGLNYYGSNNIVWIHINILGYNDNNNAMWNIFIDDENGLNHACLYGSDNWLVGKSGTNTTSIESLTNRQFHDIDIKINTATHTADFYANRTLLGQLSYPNGQSAKIDRIRLERIDNSAAANAMLLIGDIFVGEEDISPPNTPRTPFRYSACQQSTSIKFNWPAVNDSCSGLAGYYVQVGTSPGEADIADCWIGNTTSYTFTGTSGTTYYCRVYAKDNAGNQSGWSNYGSSLTTFSPPALQVDGQPFFPIGYYTSAWPSSVEGARNYLSTQHAQGMNMALSCYGLWENDNCMKYELEGAALADMKVAMEVNRYAVRGDSGYPTSLIDSQVDLLKNYTNLLGWYLIDEPETMNILPSTLQARYSQIKTRDPNHSIWAVHYAYPSLIPARPAENYLSAEPPPYCDVLSTDTYPVGYGSAEFGGPLWYVALESKAHTDLAISYGSQAYINVVQAQGYQNFSTRLPTYPEQRYISYAPIVCGARGILYWMYEAYSTPAHQENVVGPITREISSFIPAIVSNSTAICMTSNRDADTTGHGIADVSYMFGEDSRGGYLIAVNNTANAIPVTFQLSGDVLSRQLGTQSVSVPVIFESREVTAQFTGDPAMRTLTDTFSPYDVNVYRLYTLNNVVSIDLGSPDIADGMSHPQFTDGNTIVVSNVAGVNCKRNNNPNATPPDTFFYFGVSDNFAFQGNYSGLYIKVRYYDSGTGSLELRYDASDSPNKNGGTISLTGSNTWKQHTFQVTDAYFGNRQNGGADFSISGSAGNTFYLDTVSVEPAIQVSCDKPNGLYKLGEIINLQLRFPGPVFVNGNPQIEMETGPIDSKANYVSGSGTNTLLFSYVVQPGDTTADLDYTSRNALVLNGGSIKDTNGIDVLLTLPLPGAAGSLSLNKDISIDGIVPTILNVTSTSANGTYKQGSNIFIQVLFNEVVVITGSPRLRLETGDTDQLAVYFSGNNSNTLTFMYQFQLGDTSPDLDYTGTDAFLLNGGTLRDTTGNDADVTLFQPGSPGSLGYNKNFVVDAVKPTITSVTSDKPDGAYKAGENIDIKVLFNENVNVTGTPQLELETGTVDRKAAYISGHGTNTLIFRYTVEQGDVSADLNYKATNSLTIPSATIKDIAGNTATLTLPALTSQGSLSYYKALVIDTSAPTSTATPIGGVYSGTRLATLSAIEPATIYYTTDGTEPSSSSSVYTNPIELIADTTLRFYAIDTAGNEESPKNQVIYEILSSDGSIGLARQLNNEPVRLGKKVLYLKWPGFAYIEEQERWSGIRIEGNITANAGDLVCLTGTVKTSTVGEKYILLDRITPSGSFSISPLACSNVALGWPLMDGLYIKTWGKVKPGSIGDNNFSITDGSNGNGIQVLTQSAPAVNENEFVIITGAAGCNNGRIIYKK